MGIDFFKSFILAKVAVRMNTKRGRVKKQFDAGVQFQENSKTDTNGRQELTVPSEKGSNCLSISQGYPLYSSGSKRIAPFNSVGKKLRKVRDKEPW